MGQGASLPTPDGPPRTLSDRSLAAVADHIKSGAVNKIVVMTGAGISTAAGIPDFRSETTGLYANLARLNLPFPEAVFDISFFRHNPKPFYVLAKELYPGKFHPTISHVFIALLATKGLLHLLFTQNIDCLERAAGVPPELIIEAHGSFATQRCIECQTPFPDDEMRECVARGEVPRCRRRGSTSAISLTPESSPSGTCDGLVKPDIVFFGQSLPGQFYQSRGRAADADLVIVMGTSLTVQPFASLPRVVAEGVPRLLLNKEPAGGLGSRADDVVVLGDCDTAVRQLADLLGWRAELGDTWRRIVGEKEAQRQTIGPAAQAPAIKDELDRLADYMDEALGLGSGRQGAAAGSDGEQPVAQAKQRRDASPATGKQGADSWEGKARCDEENVESGLERTLASLAQPREACAGEEVPAETSTDTSQETAGPQAGTEEEHLLETGISTDHNGGDRGGGDTPSLEG